MIQKQFSLLTFCFSSIICSCFPFITKETYAIIVDAAAATEVDQISATSAMASLLWFARGSESACKLLVSFGVVDAISKCLPYRWRTPLAELYLEFLCILLQSNDGAAGECASWSARAALAMMAHYDSKSAGTFLALLLHIPMFVKELEQDRGAKIVSENIKKTRKLSGLTILHAITALDPTAYDTVLLELSDLLVEFIKFGDVESLRITIQSVMVGSSPPFIYIYDCVYSFLQLARARGTLARKVCAV